MSRVELVFEGTEDRRSMPIASLRPSTVRACFKVENDNSFMLTGEDNSVVVPKDDGTDKFEFGDEPIKSKYTVSGNRKKEAMALAVISPQQLARIKEEEIMEVKASIETQCEKAITSYHVQLASLPNIAVSLQALSIVAGVCGEINLITDKTDMANISKLKNPESLAQCLCQSNYMTSCALRSSREGLLKIASTMQNLPDNFDGLFSALITEDKDKSDKRRAFYIAKILTASDECINVAAKIKEEINAVGTVYHQLDSAIITKSGHSTTELETFREKLKASKEMHKALDKRMQELKQAIEKKEAEVADVSRDVTAMIARLPTAAELRERATEVKSGVSERVLEETSYRTVRSGWFGMGRKVVAETTSRVVATPYTTTEYKSEVAEGIMQKKEEEIREREADRNRIRDEQRQAEAQVAKKSQEISETLMKIAKGKFDVRRMEDVVDCLLLVSKQVTDLNGLWSGIQNFFVEMFEKTAMLKKAHADELQMLQQGMLDQKDRKLFVKTMTGMCVRAIQIENTGRLYMTIADKYVFPQLLNSGTTCKSIKDAQDKISLLNVSYLHSVKDVKETIDGVIKSQQKNAWRRLSGLAKSIGEAAVESEKRKALSASTS